MKNVMKLTADELATVLDTIEVTAITQTLRETPDADVAKTFNSINWQGVFSVLFEMFDNGLSAMGIEIAEEIEAVEEEDEEEVDDFGVPTDYWSEFDEEEEPEPKTDPIDDMIFDYKGKRAISESDGKLMLDMCFAVIRERNPEMSIDQQIKTAQQLFLDVARGHGIEWVKEDEDE